jgi:flagellar biosynthesis protein FlhG
MSDQADRLRQLVVASRGAGATAGLAVVAEDEPARRAREAPLGARSLLFTSGKGGVGTSNLVLNLAIALGDLGRKVLVVDADIGLANLDLLCGLAPRFDLGDVLAGRCTLSDAVMTGPGGIRIVPGAHAIRTGAEILDEGTSRLAEGLGELESESDFVLVDAGSGLGPGATRLAAAADTAVIVTTPEPTSLADAHAAIARFRRLAAPPRLRLVVSQARTAAEASEVLDRLVASCRQFLGAAVAPLGPGAVWADPHVGLAVRSRRPFVTASPASPAARSIRRLARALAREQARPHHRGRRSGYFAGLAARWALGLVATG